MGLAYIYRVFLANIVWVWNETYHFDVENNMILISTIIKKSI